MDPTIIVAIITFFGTVFSSTLAYKEKVKNKKLSDEISEHKKRADLVDKILDLTLLEDIRQAVNVFFETTSAERFLILIAVNGKTDFNVVSVIFEQRKVSNSKINAIARYRNLKVDKYYKEMLKDVERHQAIDYQVSKMPEGSLLRAIYENEGVRHSRVRHLLREPIDDNNDVLIFSTVAKFEDEPFTLNEKAIFMTQFDAVIVPSLRKMLYNGEVVKK